MNAYSQSVTGLFGQLLNGALAPSENSSAYSVRVSNRLEEVEAVWRDLSQDPMESPGQSYEFIRHWVANRKIPVADQCYVVGEVDGKPVALLPLQRKRFYGVHVYTWFPGAQVGCYAPVADNQQLSALGAAGRAALWRSMTAKLTGADLIYLRSMPMGAEGQPGLFDELGSSLSTEVLYRAQFASWSQCDGEQRSRTRRKHDRQQGDKLAALGAVEFEEVTDPAVAAEAVDTMFRQRSARFKVQGIRDPFVCDGLTSFYKDALCPETGIDVRVHTLRLDGAIVAVRYNIVEGDRMFCLISSMSDCEEIQTGSPGKQCLLRVMQTVFDKGISVFDMGSGHTDEKRHWCNVQVPLAQHYLALTPQGMAVAGAHRLFQTLRARAKANAGAKEWLRKAMQRVDHLLGRDKPRSE